MIILLIITSVFTLLITVLPLLKLPYGWIRVWDFPRIQIAVALFLCLAFWFLTEPGQSVRIPFIILLGLAICYHMFSILPYTFLWEKEMANAKEGNDENKFSMYFFNVLMDNKNINAFLQQVRQLDPDIILLVETDHEWAQGISELDSLYKYHVGVPIDNTYGMMLYSKLKLSNTNVKYLLEEGVPSIHTYVELKSGKQFKFYCVHPKPPSPVTHSHKRDAELLIVAKKVSERKEPAIVTGDLNDVAWSYTTRLFKKVSGMHDPRVGRILLNTFNAKIPVIRWPLDHFFFSDHFTFNALERLPFIGSDHFPIIISCTFEKDEATEHIADDLTESKKDEANERINEGVNDDVF